MAWALRPVAANIALLHERNGYRAYDYVTRLVDEQATTVPPRDTVWVAAIGSAAPAEAYAVGNAAHKYSRLEDAARALTRARDSSAADLAAFAGLILGVTLGELGRRQEAVDAYGRVVAAYGADPDPKLRKIVERATTDGQRLEGEGEGPGRTP